MNALPEAFLTDAKLKRTSTAEQVTEIVRNAILSGALLPGTPLREGQLAASLGISRHTFREAMRLLVSEGLVSHNLHRGVTVAQLNAEDVRDLYHARHVLELAALDAIRDDPEGCVARLRPIVDELERAADAQDWRRLDEHDMAFHREIVASLGSHRLDATYAGFQRELRLGLALSEHLPQVAEHRAMMEMIEQRRWDDLRRLLGTHLLEGQGLVAEAARDQQSPDG